MLEALTLIRDSDSSELGRTGSVKEEEERTGKKFTEENMAFLTKHQLTAQTIGKVPLVALYGLVVKFFRLRDAQVKVYICPMTEVFSTKARLQ